MGFWCTCLSLGFQVLGTCRVEENGKGSEWTGCAGEGVLLGEYFKEFAQSLTSHSVFFLKPVFAAWATGGGYWSGE